MEKLLLTTVLLSCCLALANCANITPAEMEILVAARQYCEGLHSTPPELVEKAKHGELVNDESLKNFLFCWFQRIDFMNAKGGFNWNLIETTLVNIFSDGQNIYDKCSGINEASGPESAFKFAGCFHEHATDHVIEEKYY